MSFEDRLRSGIAHSAAQLGGPSSADVDRALLSIRAAAERRQRLRLLVMTTAAVGLVVLLATSQRIGELLWSVPLPQPADEQTIDDESDEKDDITNPDPSRPDAVAPNSDGGRLRVAGTRAHIPVSDSQRNAPEGTGRPDAAPDSGREPTHTESAEYAVVDPVSSASACWAARQCPGDIGFRAENGDRWISIEIADSGSQDVYARIYVDINANGNAERQYDVCNDTSEPIRVRPGAAITVRIFGAGCPNTGKVTGSPSSGTIYARFYSD